MDDDEAFQLAEEALDKGDTDKARNLLKPLVERDHPAAIRLNSSFFPPGMSEEEMDRIYVEGIERAAKLGDMEARYLIGSWYDLGDCGYETDRPKASQIFKELASEGHAHCTWIYACELMWGLGSFAQNVSLGLEQLDLAIERGSANAAITKARLFDEGLLGIASDKTERDIWRAKAREIDEYVYDPYE